MFSSLIRSFVRHPVAPNLAMIVMIIAGIWALSQLNRQLLPTFQLNVVTVTVEWSGASAEDVQQGITQPLEDQLLGMADLSKLTSASRDGRSQISLEFPDQTDMGEVLERIKQRVAQVRNLPQTAEEPKITQLARTDPLMRLVVTGASLPELRPAVRAFERELRTAGISRLEITGLPKEEIAIQVSSRQLSELGLPINELAGLVADASLDVPAGSAGRSDIARSLRTSGQQRDVAGFEELAFRVREGGQRLTLNDIATVVRRAIDGEPELFVDGAPAVEIRIRRGETEDAIEVAEAVYRIMDSARDRLPPNASLEVYDETWRLVDERLDLMIDNGIAGLALVVVILYLFLNARVALWVAIGIPVSVMAAMMALYLFGGSLNMISLFAMVMALGIIVDDAIVVGEEAVTAAQRGEGPLAAAEKAALRMLAPVAASSLTTVAAFLPLLTLSGATGSILFAIPLVVICVVVASLMECFVVLPGHLRYSLAATAKRPPSRLRRVIDVGFRRFRDRHVRAVLRWSVGNRKLTVAIGVASLIVSVGLLSGGRLAFSFFPQPDNATLFANARFVAGSPESRISGFLDQAAQVLAEQLPRETGVLRLIIKRVGEDSRGSTGSHLGHLAIELAPNDDRDLSNAQIIQSWRAAVPQVPGLESFNIAAGVHGPPGADIEIQLYGNQAETLKAAALDIESILGTFPGVWGIRSDTSYGREQLIFALTPAGRAAGLTEQSLSAQLRAAFDGQLVQIFQDRGDEVEVRMMLPDAERNSLGRLDTLPVVLPGGLTSALANVATTSYGRGFETLRHNDGRLAVSLTASVDRAVNNANAVRGELARTIMPQLAEEFGVAYSFGGDASNQQESFAGLALALPLSLLLIFIILAWVFESYVWPFAVVSVIPFGIVGALLGHWLLGFDLTIMSIFGLFGLSGIVINDSIILVTVYKKLRESGSPPHRAAVDAGLSRFRAVLLTTVTTVFGVMPILFEQAQQAQFLKPMVISIGFGLVFGTFMVLVLLPTLLVAMDRAATRMLSVFSRFPSWFVGQESTQALNADYHQRMRNLEPATRAAARGPGRNEGS